MCRARVCSLVHAPHDLIACGQTSDGHPCLNPGLQVRSAAGLRFWRHRPGLLLTAALGGSRRADGAAHSRSLSPCWRLQLHERSEAPRPDPPRLPLTEPCRWLGRWTAASPASAGSRAEAKWGPHREQINRHPSMPSSPLAACRAAHGRGAQFRATTDGLRLSAGVPLVHIDALTPVQVAP